MPRTSRMIIEGEKAVYHIISRTALAGLPFGDVEKDEFVKILKWYSKIYFVDVMGYAVMSNHFHLLVTMRPKQDYTDEEIKRRFHLYYGEKAEFSVNRIAHYREKWGKLSDFVREIKQRFSRYYNKMNGRRGTLWGERFKSVLVEKGETLINCLAYIDLNAVRAGIVKRPEDYRWCSLGYHSRTSNKDGFLSTDFGLVEFGVLNETERFRRYRRYVYEAGAIARSDGKSSRIIESSVVEKERKKNYKVSQANRFLYKTRYFTDSGIIGSKAFVKEHYQQFKHMFQSKHEKKPNPVKGIVGMYSLKRLSLNL